MTRDELAYEIARGIGLTGVEGRYGSVSCSTAGDYPSMGISQWEGLDGRGDALLNAIDGGDRFAGRTYSDIEAADELDALADVLASESGQEAQNRILAEDCLAKYVPALMDVADLDDSRCFVYAGIWCPTSHNVVSRFLANRAHRVDIRNLAALRDVFRDEYFIAADVGDEYAEGYANRAQNTFDYVASLDLSAYGVPEYA